MAKVFFWNLKRLGAATEDIIQDKIKARTEENTPDIVFLCELSTKATFPDPQNLTYRKESAYQLCYGCYKNSDKSKGILQKYTPIATDGYKSAGYKGGNDFTDLADRAVAYYGIVDKAHLYTFHAPSRHDDVRAMAFLAASLNKLHSRAPWVLIGDFNIDPNLLAKAPVGINLADLILHTREATHERGGILDYVLTNIDKESIKLEVRGRFTRELEGLTDHIPILVEWPI
ncbi:endonuclease/exonuclease/phosphatase family protein [Leptospira koniambonensis]|uniref:endonuclease/exonuclease/phosphatase family protein n=1 Tax=Leptospira koniambonensis TaxID=2484950 RepID=UPI003EB9CB52